MSRIGMPGGHPGTGRASRCLGQHVTAYADRAMDAASLRHWDLHLVACVSCRSAVETERRVLASLRSSAAAVPGDLRGMLLALANEVGAAPSPEPVRGFHPARHHVPPVPVAPVPVVGRGAPALHRSARRATLLAGLAAGATAAAAWGLAVTGTGVSATPAPAQGPVQRSWQGSAGFTTAAFVVPGLGAARAVGVSSRPTLGTAGQRSTQSTP